MDKKKNSKKKEILKYIIISLLIFLAAFLLSALASVLLSLIFKDNTLVEHIVGSIEGVIAAIAAGLVLYQLKEGEKTELRQSKIEEASFTLQYNQAFIQDSNMMEVERLLEDQAYFDVEPKEIITHDNRQKFINYLVYLESMAQLVTMGVLDLDYIDNLMAYRFFIAIDNLELQSKELIPFAKYYRGCFELYKVWYKFREEKGLKCPKDDCKNKWAMKSLSECQEFNIYSK